MWLTFAPPDSCKLRSHAEAAGHARGAAHTSDPPSPSPSPAICPRTHHCKDRKHVAS